MFEASEVVNQWENIWEFLVWKYLQNIFLDDFSKSKTMRNFLSAIDIQFLYG